VQYHTCLRRKDANAENKLRILRDCVRRWEGAISPDHMSARRKTAEIISLLYQATQGPPPATEAPVLNPTGGVVGKQLVGPLAYKKDPSRPGGGVFVALGDSRKGNFEGVVEGVIINSSDEEREGEESAAKISSPTNDRSFLLSSSTSALSTADDTGDHTASAPAVPRSTSLVNFTPLRREGGESISNVNPAMNTSSSPGNVRVFNVLDVPQAQNMPEQFATADNLFLEGIPGGMFDWTQWDTFFSRFGGQVGENHAGLGFQQRQQQHNNATASDPEKSLDNQNEHYP